MAANPKDPRTKRRASMGDDPNKISMSVQPTPGSPQGPGNIMNNPNNARSFNPMPSATSLEGSPVFNSPYGDNQHAYQDGRLGAVDPNMVPPSGLPQGRGYKGLKQNSFFPIDGQPTPSPKQMEMDEPIYNMAQAMGNTEPGGLGLRGEAPPWEITPMGMGGRSPEMALNNPISGQIQPNMTEQMPTALPLNAATTGGVDGNAKGMDTKKGKR